MAPKRDRGNNQREDNYKKVRVAKNSQYGGCHKIPLCKSCYEGHLRCPGPEIASSGSWDFSKKCLRCADGGDIDCDFEAEMTRVPKGELATMTKAQKKAVMVTNETMGRKRPRAESPSEEGQPSSKIRRSDDLPSVADGSSLTQPIPSQPRLQSSTTQSFRAPQPSSIQPTAVHPSENEAEAEDDPITREIQNLFEEDDLINHEIRNLFREDPEVAHDVLASANISGRRLIPNAGGLIERNIVPARHIDALRETPLEAAGREIDQSLAAYTMPTRRPAPSMFPDPSEYELTLTTPLNHPGGFLYDGPYPRVEHDWEAEVKMYDEQRKEARKKAREAEKAARGW